MLERHFTAERINEIVNHPVIRPWVADENEGVLDLTAKVEDKRNVFLIGEHGGIILLQVLPGIYEAHTQVLPEARGEWTQELIASVMYWMFTKTNCYEIITRVPKGHIAALAATKKSGMKYEFTRPDGCKFRGKILPIDIYGIRIQDWVLFCPYVSKRGEWFHNRLHEEAERLKVPVPAHDTDENHNRFVGASWEMGLNGQIAKGIAFYNRWAIVSRHESIALVSENPPLIKIDSGLLLKIIGSDIEMMYVLKG